MNPLLDTNYHGLRVVRAAWAGVPWLRGSNGANRKRRLLQVTGGNREAFAGFHTVGENPAAAHQ